MPIQVIQFADTAGSHNSLKVGLPQSGGDAVVVLDGAASVYDLALAAARSGQPLETVLLDRAGTARVSFAALIAEKRLLPPLTHPDPAHLILSGTGLNHLGSAMARNAMHTGAQPNAGSGAKTDSMRMFESGLAGGRPAAGEVGSQPEWFYKGDGRWVTPPEGVLPTPPWGLDGGEEAELAGAYVIGEDGAVLRVGFALGNEFSDHVMERQNYLLLAHSKLRACSFGPALLIGDIPADVRGTVRITRAGSEIWSAEFSSGEANMSHTLANLEHHHFKYEAFRRPGDAHVHFFGASALSCTSGISTQAGDIFEISSPLFGAPLRNTLGAAQGADTPVAVRAL